MNRTAAAMLVAAALGAGLGAPSEALAADWRIRIDNYGNPDAPSHWGTPDEVFVSITYAKNGSEFVTTGPEVPFAENIGNHDIWIDNAHIPLSGVISISVYIGFPGTNMFVIDEIEVFDTSGNLYYSSGVDNMVGYCISRDRDDYENNPECYLGDGDVRKIFFL